MLLDSIKSRHLLTLAQEKLASMTGIADPYSRVRSAVSWREALGDGEELSQRMEKARELLAASCVKTDRRIAQFVRSEAGMQLVCELHSPIREAGDGAAHPSSNPAKLFRDAVLRHEQSEGLTALMNLVCMDT